VLLLADEAEMISEEQLVNWGATGIINQPLDIEELKLKVGNFLETYSTTDRFPEVNIDEFKLDNLDEELRNLNLRQEPSPPTPPVEQRETYIKNDMPTSELDQILAEIDETPILEQKEEEEMKAEKMQEDFQEQEEIQEQEEETQEEVNEIMATQESKVTPLKTDTEVTPSPSMPSSAHFSSAPGGGAIEDWFRGIAEEKIAQVIAHEDFSQIVERIARDVVPRIAEELVSKEIERIKQKIVG
jgi:hypothetical protein